MHTVTHSKQEWKKTSNRWWSLMLKEPSTPVRLLIQRQEFLITMKVIEQKTSLNSHMARKKME